MTLASSDLTESYSPDNAQLGKIRTRTETITSGENLAQYSVVARNTSTGKLVEADNAAADGSEVPIGILPEAVDASGGDTDAPVIIGGDFNKAKVNWPASYDTQAEKDAAFDGTDISLIDLT